MRGLSQGSDETEAFLHPSYEALSDPFLLPDMDKAVKRLLKAAKGSEKVLVYGDYDVDYGANHYGFSFSCYSNPSFHT